MKARLPSSPKLGRGASLEGFDPLHADGLDHPSQLFDALAKPGELLVGNSVML